MKASLVCLFASAALGGLGTASSVVASQSPRPAGESQHGAEDVLVSPETAVLERLTTKSQPSTRRLTSAKQFSPHWRGRQRRRQFETRDNRQLKSSEELGKEAFLKLRNLSGDRTSRKLVTFDILIPFAQAALTELKKWDHPIGHAVNAFEDAVAFVQKEIGGEQVPEIYGNKLKLRMICFLSTEDRDDSVGRACSRLREHTEPQALEQERKIETLFMKIFEDCVAASSVTDGDEQNELMLRHCEALSRQTLDLKEATEQLIAFRELVQQRVKHGGHVDVNDVNEAARLIEKGGFGTLDKSDPNWPTKMATFYLGDVLALSEPKKDDQPAWLGPPMVYARDIPKNHPADVKASLIVYDGVYKGQFTEHDLEGEESCWSALGLVEFRPYNWDERSAALTYVNLIMRASQLECKACESPETLGWELRCGSIVA
ncbi:uncharacterized protein MAM_06937 [Metarhizium album ARSEF 1941]|uniref:Heat-labile enterotoxin IIA, A chain n=1 Tax=Metarhizium album (strain ARSEF 1941) TaxID=1081103 RepID=A0A0B2WGU8_METAS|nr:uncharacterized protein MAM_06937 [Metarhizium album ARSEF 1941]KHN95226.1 hypothetical protein MAM_06937 [Metarhizium album ARSEF 1941]